MFLKTIGTYSLQFLALAESIMAAPSNAFFLFPPKMTRRFEVDSWTIYALRETSYATPTTISKVTHCKSTRNVAHDFLIVASPAAPYNLSTLQIENQWIVIPLPSIPPTPSRGSGSMTSLFAIVNTNDRVRVPENGLKVILELFALSIHATRL